MSQNQKIKRTLVIGDIHGGLKALEQILDRSGFNGKEDQLIFLGDYVDGWSESSELIEFLIQLEELCDIKPIFLLGNHDTWCKEWLNTGIAKPIWLQQGGAATYESYQRTGLHSEDKHMEFFNKLLDYYIDDQNRGFVHGGFTARQGLGHEPYTTNYYWDRDLWSTAMWQDVSTDKISDIAKDKVRRFEKHKEVFIGHTTTMNYLDENSEPITIPMNKCNVWNIDTGAGWSGKLSIMDIDTKEVWQSDYVKELYPNEKGR